MAIDEKREDATSGGRSAGRYLGDKYDEVIERLMALPGGGGGGVEVKGDEVVRGGALEALKGMDLEDSSMDEMGRQSRAAIADSIKPNPAKEEPKAAIAKSIEGEVHKGKGGWEYEVQPNGDIKIVGAPEGKRAGAILSKGGKYDAAFTAVAKELGLDIPGGDIPEPQAMTKSEGAGGEQVERATGKFRG